MVVRASFTQGNAKVEFLLHQASLSTLLILLHAHHLALSGARALFEVMDGLHWLLLAAPPEQQRAGGSKLALP